MDITVFWSEKCNACLELWTVIMNEGIQRMFREENIYRYPTEKIMKLGIDKVPTIIVSVGGQKPMIFEGGIQCSQWLNQMIQNRRMNMKQMVENERRLIQRTQALARLQDGGAAAYDVEEM
jgi:hypothetical protein